MRPLLAIFAALAAFLAPGATPGSASTDTLVTYHRTGGFAGVDDRVRIYTDRTVRIRSRDGATRRVRITANRMRKLRAALEAARFGEPFPQQPIGCSDCFEIDLRYKGSKVHITQASQSTRFDGVLRLLTPIVDGR